MCEKLYDIWWRNLGYVGGKYEEIGENRNENASADVCRQIEYKTESPMQTCGTDLALSVLEIL